MSQATDAGLPLVEPEPDVAAKLAEYDTTREPLALKEAADAAALHDGQAPPNPSLALPLARQRVASWLAILARFKRDLDPTFNPNDKPVMRIRPPGPDGLQYAPGVDPKDVKDPAMREAYIAAIEANRERIANFGRNAKLFEAHRIVLERARPSVADAHHTLGLPVEEINAMLLAADILPPDRDALRAAAQG